MKFKPNGNWIVVPDPIVTETKAGIILDEETAKSNAKKSNVMIDPRTEAIKAPIDGKNYLLISEHQILGKW